MESRKQPATILKGFPPYYFKHSPLQGNVNNCTTVKGAAAVPLQGLSFWESSPPMGPPENLTSQHENQEGRRRRLPCRPRTRRCLLKGCEQRRKAQER